ncbi:MAG: NAD(P)-binding protein, partial [Gammaproteobacteria bacterium]|nr:NAD(P)-binding protein [Gammaproteobacteria bacterium]
SVMGRVCPAPCQAGCNRNQVDDFVGINAVEQFIGDHAVAENYRLACDAALGGKRVAIVGAGPAGLAAACQLRRRGHASVIFDEHAEPGGMMRYGIPNYRTPRATLDREIARILDLGGIELRMNTRVGAGNPGDSPAIEDLEREFDAILWAIGCQSGRALPVAGGDAPNCVNGVAFLDAFNRGRLQAAGARVVCVGGGDTSIDVVSVARRLGNIRNASGARAETVIGGYVAHDSARAARREGAKVTLTSLFPRAQMTATEHEIEDALREGVDIRYGVMPVEVVLGGDGRAVALRMRECRVEGGAPVALADGEAFDIECDLIVSAIGQGVDWRGLEALVSGDGDSNGSGNSGAARLEVDSWYRVTHRPGHFAAGDIIRPHLLTTAIGQASIAADSIDRFLAQGGDSDCADSKPPRRPKVDVHHFNLLDKLREADRAPAACQSGQHRGSDSAAFAVHNYEDRSRHEVIPSDKLFLGHFNHDPRNRRARTGPDAEQVLEHFDERRAGLDADAARAEAGRCMSCGMCFECDNCVVYCPQKAVFKVGKDRAAFGRYVDTDYARCIGCHICAEVCPTGYIDMGLGE